MRAFQNNIVAFRMNRKYIGTDFTFKLILLTSIIIKIILRSTTAWTLNINGNSFTITTFNRFNVIFCNQLLIIFMFNLNKRLNNSRFINMK